jgi:chromosome segregation ATPase
MKFPSLTICLSLILAALSGCATAGSTVAQLDQQSFQLSQELQKEQKISSDYSDERARLDRQISTLKAQEKSLAKSSLTSDSIKLADVRAAITKLEKQRSSLVATAKAAGGQ